MNEFEESGSFRIDTITLCEGVELTLTQDGLPWEGKKREMDLKNPHVSFAFDIEEEYADEIIESCRGKMLSDEMATLLMAGHPHEKEMQCSHQEKLEKSPGVVRVMLHFYYVDTDDYDKGKAKIKENLAQQGKDDTLATGPIQMPEVRSWELGK